MHPWSLMISSVAKRMVLALGFKHLLKRALTVTRKPCSLDSLVWPGASFGTMTKREMHLGFLQGETTGVLRMKSLMIFAVAGFPCQLKAFTEGSWRLPLAYSSRSSYSYGLSLYWEDLVLSYMVVIKVEEGRAELITYLLA